MCAGLPCRPRLVGRIWQQRLPIRFRAEFNSLPILDALDALEDMEVAQTHAKVMAIPIWEGQLMIQLNMREDEYIQLPKTERARKIIALKLGDWLQVLEYALREESK